MKKVDARGLSCPQPVLLTKNAVDDNPKELEVLVDNNTAKNNVTRFLENSGYSVGFKNDEENIVITARK